MAKLETYLKENNNLSIRPLKDNNFKVFAEGLNVVLNGDCSKEHININIESKAGQVLYPVNESFESEDTVIERLEDILEMFNKASVVESNGSEELEVDSEDKTIILDDAELDTIPEEVSTGYNNVSELIKDLISVAEKSTVLTSKIELDDSKLKSVLIGLIASIYSLIDDFEEFKEDMEDTDEEVEESVSVASKIDYKDLAASGLSQAKYALEQFENYDKYIKILEDIKSDIVISK